MNNIRKIKLLKSQKAITLMSLIVYITIMFFVLAATMRIITYFKNNMDYVADVTFETEFEKFNLYMLQETSKKGNEVESVSLDHREISFTSGNTFSYTDDYNKGEIYFNSLKLCENIEYCSFSYETDEETSTVIVNVEIQIGSTTKEMSYVIINSDENINTEEEYEINL